MLRKPCGFVACLSLSVVVLTAAALGQTPPPLKAPGLSTAPAEELMRVYGQLRSLQGSGQSGVAETAVWKRDAGTFTFKDGKITFAAPGSDPWVILPEPAAAGHVYKIKIAYDEDSTRDSRII